MTTVDRVKALEARCKLLEQRLTYVELPRPVTDLSAIEGRLAALEQTVPVDVSMFAERLAALEAELDPVTGSVLRDRPQMEGE